jgi:hypothetical protein
METTRSRSGPTPLDAAEANDGAGCLRGPETLAFALANAVCLVFLGMSSEVTDAA